MDGDSVRVVWFDHAGCLKSRLLRADQTNNIFGIPFVAFGEIFMIAIFQWDTQRGTTVYRIGDVDSMPVMGWYAHIVPHVCKLPDGDEVVSCTYRRCGNNWVSAWRISGKDKTPTAIECPSFVRSPVDPIVYYPIIQKFITLHHNERNDILAPIIPRRIVIGNREHSVLNIWDTYGDRILIQVGMAFDGTGYTGYSDSSLLEYNTTTSSAVILAGINIGMDHAAYAAENILVVMTYSHQDHVVSRVFINIVDGSKYTVTDSV